MDAPWAGPGVRAGVPLLAAAALVGGLVAGPAGGTAREPDLRDFYRQSVAWGGCPAAHGPPGMACGTVRVPLDYAHPGSDDMTVAVSRIRATGPGPRLGSLLVNFGGPGLSGITELGGRAADNELARLNQRYDLVGFDPRGVARSTPVNCGNLADVTAPAPAGRGSTSVADVAATQAGRIAAACRKMSGWLLPFVGTANAARDLDVIRQTLGDDRLSFLGFSYGGRLGSVYAHEFPQRTGRMVLDGVPDPTLGDAGTALGQAAAFQHALGDFAADCAAHHCPVPGRTGDQVLAGITAGVRRLDSGPLATTSGRLDRAGYLAGIQNALYSKDSWRYLRQALGDVRGGDGELMMRLAYPSELGQAAPMGWAGDSSQDNYEVAKLAIDCRDTPERRTPAQLSALDARFAAASPLFGPSIETTLLSCTGWPAGDPTTRRVTARTAPEALLVATTGDPATPYGGAAHMAAALANGSHVLSYRGEGHGAYFAHNRCVATTVDAYLLEGALPREGTRC